MADVTPEEFLERWHAFVAAPDPESLVELVHEDVVFRSPFFHAPQTGRDYTVAVLGAVVQAVEGFTYHRQLITGRDLALEFEAKVGDLTVKGIDLLRIDAAGRIVDFEVFVRPMNGLQALGEAVMAGLKG